MDFVKTKKWSFLILVVVLGMVLAACGGDDDSTDTTAAGGDGETTTTAAGGGETTTTAAASGEDVTLRVLVHQNPPMVAFMEAFNDEFEAANPNITVDMSVVETGELATVTQTRLSANDVDVIDIFGFSNGVADYMSGATAPAWQQLIDAGLLLDITDQPFVQNYDEASIADAGTYNGKVYQVNLGRVSYSGMFVNDDLLAEVGVATPTTWGELVAACDTIEAAGYSCMTVGGGDGWPVFVGAYGLLGAFYPDQEALVEGLWTGGATWNDATSIELFERYKTYAQDMLEPGVTGLSHDAAPARYAAGDVAFMPTGVWQAPAVEDAGTAFSWTYVPFPGSDNASDNQYLFGKYDQGWSIAANSPNQEAALAYVAAFSDPANYQEFVNAVGFLPTQPTATLETQLGEQVAQYLANYRVGFEQFWVEPAGAGQWSNGSLAASWYQPFNEWDDATALANASQSDLQAGLDANG
jgi:raffinose/stachyose/melibiose transport system substrate-binding protein